MNERETRNALRVAQLQPYKHTEVRLGQSQQRERQLTLPFFFEAFCATISIDAGASSCTSSSSSWCLCLLSPASLDLPLIVYEAEVAARCQLGGTLRLLFWLRWLVAERAAAVRLLLGLNQDYFF
jgi:hypothetical protein